MTRMETNGAITLTEISFKGRTWVDARSVYAARNAGDSFEDWVADKIRLYRLAEELDYLPVDYDDSGALIRARGTEYLFAPKVSLLLLSEKEAVKRRPERKPFTNPYGFSH
jgi:hypothetical protein